jgi:hypothetical protein
MAKKVLFLSFQDTEKCFSSYAYWLFDKVGWVKKVRWEFETYQSERGDQRKRRTHGVPGIAAGSGRRGIPRHHPPPMGPLPLRIRAEFLRDMIRAALATRMELQTEVCSWVMGLSRERNSDRALRGRAGRLPDDAQNAGNRTPMRWRPILSGPRVRTDTGGIFQPY